MVYLMGKKRVRLTIIAVLTALLIGNIIAFLYISDLLPEAQEPIQQKEEKGHPNAPQEEPDEVYTDVEGPMPDDESKE
jgi:hypothetical protein